MRTDKEFYIRAARKVKRKEWLSSGKFGRFIAKTLAISVVLFYIGLGWANYQNKPSFGSSAIDYYRLEVQLDF